MSTPNTSNLLTTAHDQANAAADALGDFDSTDALERVHLLRIAVDNLALAVGNVAVAVEHIADTYD